MITFRALCLRATLLTLAALSPALPVTAQTAPDGVIVIDVLPGWVGADGVRMAGLRLRLKSGWKTYWRAPGDTGIPPQFDWSGSDNLRAVRVHWPAPDVFDDNGLRTIGYKTEVVLPVELFPADPDRPTHLDLQMALGVCRDICLPVNLGYATTLVPGMAETGAGEIRAALKERPRAGAAMGGPAICELAPIADGLRLTMTVTLPDQGATEAVVFEPGRSDLWVSEAEVTRSGGRLTASADIVPPEGKPFALARGTLRTTVLGAHGAAEYMGCDAG
jgi:DsbC/DsbD-like thiol-disulfide interchange protein